MDSTFCYAVLIIIAVVCVIVFIYNLAKNHGTTGHVPPPTTPPTPRQPLPREFTHPETPLSRPTSTPAAPVRHEVTSSPSTRTTTASTRPQSATSVKQYHWVEKASTVRTAVVTPTDMADLVDAFSGVPLNSAESIYQCQQCKVMYQGSSYEFLRQYNHGQCVSCKSLEIHPVAVGSHQQGINVNPNVITLTNYRQYVGRGITFRGVVVDVSESRRGGDYILFFEEGRSYSGRFKLVVFRDHVSNFGGAAYFYSLVNRQVDVRGVLQDDDRFGYEILLNDPSMLGQSR